MPAFRGDLSVVVTCRDRPDALALLLEGLRRQSFPPDRYEVILVDDGSEPPIATVLDDGALRGVDLLRQEASGPAAGRNLALGRARGRIVVFLNADAIPASPCLELHAGAHRGEGPARAVLGRFDFTDACRTLVVRLCEHTGTLFPFHRMPAGRPLTWELFCTANLSVPADAVHAVGGFDPAFRWPVWEDVELGYRLHGRGVHLWHDPSIECLHHHPVDLPGLLLRYWRTGHEAVRFARLHPSVGWMRLARRLWSGREWTGLAERAPAQVARLLVPTGRAPALLRERVAEMLAAAGRRAEEDRAVVAAAGAGQPDPGAPAPVLDRLIADGADELFHAFGRLVQGSWLAGAHAAMEDEARDGLTAPPFVE